uniref:Methylated-DNA--protein-cysteine methyltransferase n=1 Tax=Leptospirillum ferriphilum TaxID=178606 RepID=A0A7C3LUR0_9BACT
MTMMAGTIDTPLGEAILIVEGDRVVEFFFAGQRSVPGTVRRPLPASRVLEEAKSQINEYFLKKRQSFTVPADPKGTDFQRRVWEVLKGVPFGETLSYQDIALGIGEGKNYARPVASAIAQNPVMILIPCHRIIGADGSLTGYAGGLGRKKALLELEGSLQAEDGRRFFSKPRSTSR